MVKVKVPRGKRAGEAFPVQLPGGRSGELLAGPLEDVEPAIADYERALVLDPRTNNNFYAASDGYEIQFQ